jgi:hypothetical protein
MGYKLPYLEKRHLEIPQVPPLLPLSHRYGIYLLKIQSYHYRESTFLGALAPQRCPIDHLMRA